MKRGLRVCIAVACTLLMLQITMSSAQPAKRNQPIPTEGVAARVPDNALPSYEAGLQVQAQSIISDVLSYYEDDAYGGCYIDNEGTLHVMLLGDSSKQARRLNQALRPYHNVIVTHMVKYSYQDLLNAQQAIDNYWEKLTIYASGVDVENNRIFAHVYDSAKGDALSGYLLPDIYEVKKEEVWFQTSAQLE